MKTLFIQFNNGVESIIDVAETSEEQARGLMGVDWPPQPMAFPSKRPEWRSFWMKDTPSPLDILFCLNGEVLQIENGAPHSLEGIGSKDAIDMVLEFPKGFCAKNKISPGTKFSFKEKRFKTASKFEKILSKQRKKY